MVVETETRKKEVDVCKVVMGQSRIGFGGYES